MSQHFACATGCKLACQKVPDELRQQLRDRVIGVYRTGGTHAVAEELKAVTLYGQDV
jgi:hypothetical protein